MITETLGYVAVSPVPVEPTQKFREEGYSASR